MLKPHDKANFETLCEAFDQGDVVLAAGRRLADGTAVALVCAVSHDSEGNVTLTPFAELVTTDPFETYEPAWVEPTEAVPVPNCKGGQA